MTIVRVKKSADNPFVMIDKRLLKNPALSWKAKGLLAYLLSNPDDWQIWVTDLIKRSTDGEHAVRSGLKELQSQGYVTRDQKQDGQGKFGPVCWTVHEQPLGGFPQADKPQAENHDYTNNDSTKKDSTNIISADADFPDPVEPAPRGYKPGPGKLISCVDPDTDEEVGEEDWRSPSTQVQANAFRATGRLHFGSKTQRRRLERIERLLEDGTLSWEFWKNRCWNAENRPWSLNNLIKFTTIDKQSDWEARQ